MELVGLPSPAGWSCAALAEPAEPSPGAVGRAESSSTSCCVWGHGGYQTIAPQAASPASPTTGKTGSRGAIIEKIVGREESPSATCSVFIFSAATPFPQASPTLPLFPHLHPFPLHSFPISPLTLLFYLPFSSLSPSHASPSYFLSSLHPVFSHVMGKTSPPSILPLLNASSSLPLQPQAVLHLLSPFLLPSPLSGLLC